MKMKKQNTPPQNWPAVKTNTPPPAGNDPELKTFIIGYSNDENVTEGLMQFKDKADADFRSEEWCEVKARTLQEAFDKYEEAFLKWREDQSKLHPGTPAGNDLPEQLTYDPFDDHDSFYFESTRLGNDYDFRIEWSEHFARKREALRDEIVCRYNLFPEVSNRLDGTLTDIEWYRTQNKELLEALKFVSEVLPHLRPDKTLTGGDHFSLIGKIDNLKTIITKYSK